MLCLTLAHIRFMTACVWLVECRDQFDRSDDVITMSMIANDPSCPKEIRDSYEHGIDELQEAAEDVRHLVHSTFDVMIGMCEGEQIPSDLLETTLEELSRLCLDVKGFYTDQMESAALTSLKYLVDLEKPVLCS